MKYKSETLNKGPVPLAVREGYIQLKSVDFFNKSRPRHLDKGPKLKRLPKKENKGPVPRKIRNNRQAVSNGCVLDFRLMKD